jgi:hypothetical protein
MSNIINKKINKNFTTLEEIEVIKDMMKHNYLALDYKKEFENFKNTKSYELPDRKIISLNEERFIVPELIFQPSLYGIKESKYLKKILKI